MYKILGHLILLLLLVLPTTILLVDNGGSRMLVSAEDRVEDEVIDEEEDAHVDTEDDSPEEPSEVTATEGEEEEAEKPIKPSPDASTVLLFTKPTGQQLSNVELPAGEPVKVLVGFRNTGQKDFIVESMDAAFRYPQDYSYYIQNFTAFLYERVVTPASEASFLYMFTPSESFSARPFGLTINVNYKDSEGNFFQDAIFNDTINITEPDEGLDGETFFLYIFLAAMVVLLLVGAQQLLSSFSKKKLSKSKPVVEMGTQDKGDVDYDWLPMDHINKSPGRSPGKQSPRQRRNRRNKGSVED